MLKNKQQIIILETSMAKNNTWLRKVIEVLEVFFNSMQNANKKRTWNQHVVPYNDGWAVRREGNKRITSKHRKQSTAIRKAKSLARKHKADVIIHRSDGTIRDRVNYE